jgi:CRP-like cAMP-binding protein
MASHSGTRSQHGGDGSTPPAKLPQNEILSKLPASELAAVMEYVTPQSFALRDELFEEGDALENVHFPLNAMISLVNVLEDGTTVEVLTIGKEGFTGLPLLNDVSTARFKGMCQISGDCLELSAKDFSRLVKTTPELQRRLRRYSQFATEVAAQSVACNSVHEIEQRCARWLMLTADAVGSTTFEITQEFLSQMLAVRRPGVTVAMGALARRGLISHRYGKVTLVDVEGLKKVSCECYRRITEKASELLA